MKQINKKSKITLVELPSYDSGELNGIVSTDVYSKKGFLTPPRALPILAAVLNEDGWENVQMISPLFHGDENGRLTRKNFDRILESDVLCVSAIRRTVSQTRKLIEIYRKKNPDGIIIAGGMDASFRTEEWIGKWGADIVVRGEGERTFPILMNRLTSNKRNLNNINGISFRKGNKIINNPKARLMTPEEMSKLPMPYYDSAIIAKTGVWTVEPQRGCPHSCDYCLVTSTYERSIRHRPIKDVADEIERDIGYKNIPIFLSGDNFGIVPSKAIELSKEIVKRGLQGNRKIVQLDSNSGRNHELLEEMRKAGINVACVGFEAIDNAALNSVGKHSSAEQNIEAAKTLREHGIWVHAMMMAGMDTDTREVLKQRAEWAKKHADSFQFSIVTPFPGTPFYKRMVEDGRILPGLEEKDYLYDGLHCIIKPLKITPIELQEEVFQGFRDFYSLKSTLKRLGRSPNILATLGILYYTTIGNGLRGAMKSRQTLKHMRYLREVSK